MEAPESMDNFEEVYMATPLYDKDLSKILAAKVSLTTAHIQYFIYQILCALKYMHRYVTNNAVSSNGSLKYHQSLQ